MDASIILEDLIEKALGQRVSDIHIEPGEDITTVRYRLDGDLIVVDHIPKERHQEIIARLKILADLDIAERRLPQDGRISWKDTGIDLRISILPTINGEKGVLRILNSDKNFLKLEDFAFPEGVLDSLRNITRKASGMLISTGPTGCGKSTTLYGLIMELNKADTNILTIEDPVEYKIKGVNQMQVNEKAGLGFSKSLRSMLRADPDIIMVGEIRDRETADVAVRSAITGHLILSTLHTFDSYSGIIRLLDMGIEPYLIGSALSGIQSQRLVKLLCPKCKAKYQPSPQEKSILEEFFGSSDGDFYKPIGCSDCLQGYQNRIAIAEVFEIDEDFTNLIKKKSDIRAFKNLGREKGIPTMLEDGLEKAQRGLVFLADVLKVTI